MVLGKLGSYMQKNETGPLSYTTHKGKGNKSRTRLLELHQNKKLLHNGGNHQQNHKATY